MIQESAIEAIESSHVRNDARRRWQNKRRGTDLFDFELVPTVCVDFIVQEGLGIDKIVIGRRRRDNVSVACYLAGKPGDWAGDYDEMSRDDPASENGHVSIALVMIP